MTVLPHISTIYAQYVFRGQVEELQFLAKLLSNIILKCRLFLSQVAMQLNIHTTWKKTSAYTSRGLLQYIPFLPYTYILKQYLLLIHQSSHVKLSRAYTRDLSYKENFDRNSYNVFKVMNLYR